MGATVVWDGLFQERKASSVKRGGAIVVRGGVSQATLAGGVVAWEGAVEMEGGAVMGMGKAIKNAK